jgi:hypothetical protein
MVGIVAPVSGEIEGDGQALLARREVAPVEAFESSAVEKPAYCRIVQGWLTYMVG